MKRGEDWWIEGLLNTRKLTLERQFFLDDFDSLSVEAQRQVTDLVAGLKQGHQADQSRVFNNDRWLIGFLPRLVTKF
ncbi:MAG: hypothetical protein RMZ69_30415 [Nostoc sp. ChiQUE01a]|nr:hypothetical protein [Nostoc sp. ChiQUE01a]